MKKQQLALVIEGNSTSSNLLRLSSVAAGLGPIKSSGLQVARRVSNFLRAGYAVNSYVDLNAARTILIRVPDSSIDRVISEIVETREAWSGHAFVLCETWAPTDKLEPLKKLGASVASLVVLPTTREKTFVAEGDLFAVRQVRRIVDRGDATTIELRSGAKHLLFAATLLCAAIPVPVLVMAQEILREGGVSGNQLSSAMQEMANEMLSCFFRGARMTWGGALAESLKSMHGGYWDCLSSTHPDLAKTLKTYVELGRPYMNWKTRRSLTV